MVTSNWESLGIVVLDHFEGQWATKSTLQLEQPGLNSAWDGFWIAQMQSESCLSCVARSWATAEGRTRAFCSCQWFVTMVGLLTWKLSISFGHCQVAPATASRPVPGTSDHHPSGDPWIAQAVSDYCTGFIHPAARGGHRAAWAHTTRAPAIYYAVRWPWIRW